MYRPDLVARLRYTVDSYGCWLFDGYIKSNGYGSMSVRGLSATPMSAHVVSWIGYNGPVPTGLDVDHVCHNRDPKCPGGKHCLHRRCVNPDHLRITDRKSNLNAGRTPGPAKGTPRPPRRQANGCADHSQNS